MSVEISLTRGQVAIVDDGFADIADLNWHALRCNENGRIYYYAVRTLWTDGKSPKVLMHRVIMERVLGRPLQRNEQIDHIDGNPLNNSLLNLRLVTSSQNNMNKPKPSNNTSGYKGVSWNKHAKKWESYIAKSYQRFRLGYFDTAEEAHDAYCKTAEKLHGEFMRVDEFPSLPAHTPNVAHEKKKQINNTSGYIGVSRDKRWGRWCAHMTIDRKQIHLGCFDTAEEAHAAYCKAVGGELPDRPPKVKSSIYKNVSLDKDTGKWRAYITVDGKRRYIGRFSSPEEAHAAYCKAAQERDSSFANM